MNGKSFFDEWIESKGIAGSAEYEALKELFFVHENVVCNDVYTKIIASAENGIRNAFYNLLRNRDDLAVGYIDFVNFKTLNEMESPFYADKVIEGFMDLLSLGEFIGFRSGGDEFVVVGELKNIERFARSLKNEKYKKEYRIKYENGERVIEVFPYIVFEPLPSSEQFLQTLEYVQKEHSTMKKKYKTKRRQPLTRKELNRFLKVLKAAA